MCTLLFQGKRNVYYANKKVSVVGELGLRQNPMFDEKRKEFELEQDFYPRDDFLSEASTSPTTAAKSLKADCENDDTNDNTSSPWRRYGRRRRHHRTKRASSIRSLPVGISGVSSGGSASGSLRKNCSKNREEGRRRSVCVVVPAEHNQVKENQNTEKTQVHFSIIWLVKVM